VHKAVLHSGKVVAVKVVKPGVLSSIQEDLEILQPLSKLAKQMFPTVNAEKIFTDLGNQLQQECNMLEEAERLKKIQEYLKKAPDLQAPEVIDSHTTPSVLTMSFLEGKKLLAYKGNGKVASHYLGCVMDQLLTWGVCQAEPHPGNLPYDEVHQRFDFLDAGQVYFPTELQRLNFSKLLVALYSKDTSLIAENSIDPEAQKANPEGFSAYQKELEAHVQSLSLKQPESIVKTIAQISLLAQKHNLKTVSYHPMSWKTLFTGLMVGLTLDGKMNPGWVLGKKLLYKLFREDRRFLFRATSQMAISTFRKKLSTLQIYVLQGLQYLNPRRLWRSA
ncbi:MAG: hypothetical protein K2X66_15840, partial [Cyanobacteria bacterium]|nr:hypothetical protein [Cyanobacteriota bacterium]